MGPRQLLPDQLLSVFVVTWNMKEMKVRGEGGELEGERERERGRGGGEGGREGEAFTDYASIILGNRCF